MSPYGFGVIEAAGMGRSCEGLPSYLSFKTPRGLALASLLFTLILQKPLGKKIEIWNAFLQF